MVPGAEDCYQAARAAALGLLARREFSRRELQGRLLKRHAPEVVAQVLNQLEAERLLSDERFGEVYTRSRAERGYGPRRIAAELERHGIGREQARNLLDNCEGDWWVRLQQLHQRRFGSEKPTDPKERARRLRFFFARGFSGAQVEKLFRSLGDRAEFGWEDE